VLLLILFITAELKEWVEEEFSSISASRRPALAILISILFIIGS
jgi:hypothetical protein